MRYLLASNKKDDNIALKSIILFFTVFSIDLVAIPVKPRVLIIFCVFIVWISRNIPSFIRGEFYIKKQNLFWIYSTGAVFLYTLIVTIISNPVGAQTAVNSAFNFFVFTAIYSLILVTFFKDDIEFAKSMTVATFLHALIVVTSFSSPLVRDYLETIQIMELWRYSYRIIGLGIAGAGGSVYLFTVYMTNLYILMFSKGDNKIRYYLSMSIILFAIALVGRTGFYLAVLALIFWFFNNSKNLYDWILIRFKAISIFGFLVIIVVSTFQIIEIDTGLLQYTTSRLWEIFNSSEIPDNFDKMSSTLPPIEENIFGTGVVRGYTRTGYNIQHDGGYAKRYASIGLVGFGFSYLTFLLYNFINFKKMRKQDKEKKLYLFFLLCLLLFIEYKEPFIYMLSYPFSLIMLSLLINKNQSNNNAN